MALDYQLVLEGELTPEQLAVQVLPDVPLSRFSRESGRWVLDEWSPYGLTLVLRAGRDGYVDASAWGDEWAWEPAVYGSISFRIRSSVDDWRVPVRRMVQVVGRALSTHDGTVVFQRDGSLLLLREHGVIREYDADFWSHVDTDPLPWSRAG